MNTLFNPTFDEQYELARRIGDRRFGSECEHESVVNGRCAKCQRRVAIGFASGKFTRHGFTLDYAKPRQETLHKCPVCERRYGRNDMRWVSGNFGSMFVCVACAGDAQEESEE